MAKAKPRGSSSGDLLSRTKLFSRYRAGNPGLLGDVLNAVRGELYDYLLRQTGQVSRSADTIDEVYLSLTEEVLAPLSTFEEFRVCLYGTARRFNADVWNADTAKLVNQALGGGASEERATAAAHELLLRLDQEFRALPGPEREALYLTVRAELGADAVSRIMAVPQSRVDSLVRDASAALLSSAAVGQLGLEAVCRIPLHPLPARSSPATDNLSIIMQNIDRARPSRVRASLRWLGLLVTFVAMIGVAVAAVQPQFLGKLAESLRLRPAASAPTGMPTPPPPRP